MRYFHLLCAIVSVSAMACMAAPDDVDETLDDSVAVQSDDRPTSELDRLQGDPAGAGDIDPAHSGLPAVHHHHDGTPFAGDNTPDVSSAEIVQAEMPCQCCQCCSEAGGGKWECFEWCHPKAAGD